jgi:hypothetical protein
MLTPLSGSFCARPAKEETNSYNRLKSLALATAGHEAVISIHLRVISIHLRSVG